MTLFSGAHLRWEKWTYANLKEYRDLHHFPLEYFTDAIYWKNFFFQQAFELNVKLKNFFQIKIENV